ncbi:hypothetical protein Tco_0900537 [Tanacetum coccineum]
MAGSDDDIPPPPPPQTQTPTQQAPYNVSTIKLPILKKGEYDIWAMKMEHYLAHTDYPIWEVIQRGNGSVSVLKDTNGLIKVLPPKTAEEILARERERKTRTTLLMGLPEDHLAKFHEMTNAKEMWEAIKSRFVAMMNQRRCRSVSTKDANQKFLRYFKSDVKGSTASPLAPRIGLQLDHEDLEQLDEFNLEEMDLKWQVAMISMRLKKFYKRQDHHTYSSQLPRVQDVDDLEGDDLLYYDAEMELTNMILLSIPNEIYNYVDSCKTAKEMWDRVERLMRRTIQNQVDRETRFTNEFDQFVVEPGESLVSVYNRFAQLMNDFERNNMKFPTVSINTKFLNSLQPEWLKYVTQVHLAKKLTVDSFDDLFDYLSQFDKLVNASRSKKLEKSHDPLALVAHTGSSSRKTSSYYVTHPSSAVDYDEEFE